MVAVDTTDWKRDEDSPFHPFGSREKQIVICPDPAPYDFLLPRQRYLLKFSNPRAPIQFLSEVMAYCVGTVLGVSVPPSFPAVDGNDKAAAALIEFFLGRPGEQPWELIHGGDYCVRELPEFERSRGDQHTLDILLRIMEKEAANGFDADYIDAWSKIFLFDSVIGNTDRHQDNWGILWQSFDDGRIRHGRLAPAFDNGTSLGYELLEEDLPNYLETARLERYVARGRHHIRQRPGDRKGFGHLDLIVEWLRRFPASRDTIATALARGSVDAMTQTIVPMVKNGGNRRLSEIRWRFVLSVIDCRVTHLREIVGT